jgi:hypothetical protein
MITYNARDITHWVSNKYTKYICVKLSIKYPYSKGSSILNADTPTRYTADILPVTNKILSAVHVKMDGNITDMLSPARAAHAQTSARTFKMAAIKRKTNDNVSAIR